jgi:hypothetical protein
MFVLTGRDAFHRAGNLFGNAFEDTVERVPANKDSKSESFRE